MADPDIPDGPLEWSRDRFHIGDFIVHGSVVLLVAACVVMLCAGGGR